MAVNLSIKSVSASLMEKLRKRAEKNHRSLQGELMTILEQTLEAPNALSPEETIQRLKNISFKTRSESAATIREDRNKK